MHYSIQGFTHKSLHTELVPRNSHALQDLCIMSICIVRMSTVVVTYTFCIASLESLSRTELELQQSAVASCDVCFVFHDQ